MTCFGDPVPNSGQYCVTGQIIGLVFFFFFFFLYKHIYTLYSQYKNKKY